MLNQLDNILNQLTKRSAKTWVEINDDSFGMYNTNSQIKFNISVLWSSLCDYSPAYILAQGTKQQQTQEQQQP